MNRYVQWVGSLVQTSRWLYWYIHTIKIFQVLHNGMLVYITQMPPVFKHKELLNKFIHMIYFITLRKFPQVYVTWVKWIFYSVYINNVALYGIISTQGVLSLYMYVHYSAKSFVCVRNFNLYIWIIRNWWVEIHQELWYLWPDFL